MNKKTMKKTAAVMMLSVLLGGAGAVAYAQGPANGGGPGNGGPGGGSMGRVAIAVCSTTNYTDVAAKALGMDSVALRKALVSGKTLDEIATSQKVTLQIVEDALNAAEDADLQQALKDGLITQDQYDLIKSHMGAAAQADATPPATDQAGQNTLPNPPHLNLHIALMPHVPAYNVVNEFVVASKAIGVSCADLVKAVEGGQSVAQVAAGKNVQAQTVIDALTSALKAATAQDLQEGLISQVEADGRNSNALNQAGEFLYNAHQGRHGMGGFPGGPGGFPGRPDGMPGLPKLNGDPNGQSSGQSSSDQSVQPPQAPATLQ